MDSVRETSNIDLSTLIDLFPIPIVFVMSTISRSVRAIGVVMLGRLQLQKRRMMMVCLLLFYARRVDAGSRSRDDDDSSYIGLSTKTLRRVLRRFRRFLLKFSPSSRAVIHMPCKNYGKDSAGSGYHALHCYIVVE